MFLSQFAHVSIFLLLGVSSPRGASSTRLSPSDLDDAQWSVMEEFRDLIEKDLPQKSNSLDNYILLRYLAATNFSKAEALNYLKENLDWREKELIDSLHAENWPREYRFHYPYDISKLTRDGRPILYFQLGERSNITRHFTVGNPQRLVTYLSVVMFEDVEKRLRELIEERDVTQFDVIINLDGYTQEKDGCEQCLQLFREVVQKAQLHYPGAVDNVFIINAPSLLISKFPEMANDIFGENYQESIYVLGDQKSFEPVLLQHIDKEQFPNGMIKQEEEDEEEKEDEANGANAD